MLKGRSILTLAELSQEEIIRIVDIAHILKDERRRGVKRKLLEGKSLAMIFQKPSTRTRVSFEAAMFELGGHALNLGATELQLARGETIEDTARALSRYVDAVMARVYSHGDAVKLAEAASVPVVNGLSDWYHPCQVLADLQTIREAKGGFEGLKTAWVGDGSNVCNTLLIACGKMGIDMTVACPESYPPLQEAVETASKLAQKTNVRIEVTDDPVYAARGADVVATDSFVSMGRDTEREERLRVFLPRYRVNEELMKLAKKDAIFMHCLPAHRGEEVTSEVIDGPQSRVWEEAENRLHAQKALLCLVLLGEEGLPWPLMP